MKFMKLIDKSSIRNSNKLIHLTGRKFQSERFDVVSPGNVSEELPIPDHITRPSYYHKFQRPGSTVGRIEIKTNDQIERMRDSCRVAAGILRKCGEFITVGVTTDELDEFAHSEIIKQNGYPSPLRYAGFPKSICTSVNNVACHGIPDDRKLMDGDIINVDVTVFYNGYHGDCSKTYLIGNVDERGRFLVTVAEECLNEGIKYCQPNRPINGIGRRIEQVAYERGVQIMPAFVGHGIGSYFHGPPEIHHTTNRIDGVMRPGMTFTIEPVVSLGTEWVEMLEDGWTAISTDNSRSAQFEHTVLITDDGVEVLTV